MKQFLTSKKAIIVGLVLAVLVLMLGSFGVGLKVGLRKARFSYDWGHNYERNFVGPRGGMMNRSGMGGPMRGGFGPDVREFEGRDFRNAHGVTGTIISIADNSLVIKDRDGKENSVSVGDQTLIRQMRTELKLNDLKMNDEIVVIGKPGDDGVIQATLIRIFPSINK